jgi:hypothetical protein
MALPTRIEIVVPRDIGKSNSGYQFGRARQDLTWNMRWNKYDREYVYSVCEKLNIEPAKFVRYIVMLAAKACDEALEAGNKE